MYIDDYVYKVCGNYAFLNTPEPILLRGRIEQNPMTMTASVLEYTFPFFEYTAEELSAFLFSKAIGLFLLTLKTGGTTAFEPENPHAFYQWLERWQVREVTMD